MNNILPKFRVHLENLNLDIFSQLIRAVRKMSVSVKLLVTRKPEKETPYVIYIEKRDTLWNSNKGRLYERRPRRELPLEWLVPCNDVELKEISDKWTKDSLFKPSSFYKEVSKKDKSNPKFCRHHQTTNHSKGGCRFIWNLIHEKILKGTLVLPP